MSHSHENESHMRISLDSPKNVVKSIGSKICKAVSFRTKGRNCNGHDGTAGERELIENHCIPPKTANER